MKGWGAFQDTTLPVGAKQKTNGVEEAYVTGVATFSTAGNVPYIVGFATEGGAPKITGFILTANNGTASGGMEPGSPAPESSTNEAGGSGPQAPPLLLRGVDDFLTADSTSSLVSVRCGERNTSVDRHALGPLLQRLAAVGGDVAELFHRRRVDAADRPTPTAS